jgi:hypothetical protein
MNCRAVMTNLGAGAIVSAMCGIGCSGPQPEPLYVHNDSVPPTMSESARSIEVPEATVRELKACVETKYRRSAEPSHAFQYNLGANDQGKVLEVNLRDSTLRDGLLEACFERALAAMEVPKDALQFRVAKPFSGGESTYSSRADISIVQAAAAPIALVPIVLVTAGVTILVGVTIYIAAEALEEQERCKGVKEDCIVACNGKLPTGDFGFRFWNCVNRCMRTAGC